MHSLLNAGNLLRLISHMPLIMKWGVAKIWDLLLGQFVQKKKWFFAKNDKKKKKKKKKIIFSQKSQKKKKKKKKNSGLLDVYSVKGCQPT